LPIISTKGRLDFGGVHGFGFIRLALPGLRRAFAVDAIRDEQLRFDLPVRTRSRKQNAYGVAAIGVE
jgi:hypothetical protein